MLDDSEDASLWASCLQETRASVVEGLMAMRQPCGILNRDLSAPIMLVVHDPELRIGERRALVDLRATVRARMAGLLEDGVLGGPNEGSRLARSQLRLDLINWNGSVVDSIRGFGVQDPVHQAIWRPLLKKPLPLLHYKPLVRRCELLLVVG